LPASSSIPTLRLGRTPKTRRDRAISNEGIGGSEPPGTLNRWSHPHKHLSPSPLGRDRVSTALGYRSTRGTRHEVSLTTAVSRSPIARVELHTHPSPGSETKDSQRSLHQQDRASGVSRPPGTLNRWSHPHKHLSPSPLGRDRDSTALGYRSTRGTRHEVSLTTAVSRSPIAPVEPHTRPIVSFFPSFAFRASGRTNSRLPTIFRL